MSSGQLEVIRMKGDMANCIKANGARVLIVLQSRRRYIIVSLLPILHAPDSWAQAISSQDRSNQNLSICASSQLFFVFVLFCSETLP